MTSASFRVQVVVDLLKKHSIKNIVFSPGSRNAPLVIGFNSDEFFVKKVLVDERSAAFYALGLAQQLQEPVVVCSTSGSAVLNYGPAIAEAYYQKIPLLVITADRPPEWIDQGEGQSMRQNNLYENFIAESFCLPMLDHPDALWQTGVITNEAIHISQLQSKPVHINFPFREPLYETVPSPTKSARKIVHHQVIKSLEKNQLSHLSSLWNKFSKKMIICGSLPKNKELNRLIEQLNNDTALCVLTENTSNLWNDKFICCIDRTLERTQGKPEFLPEIVITIGNSIISKKIKTLLRKYNPIEHWHVEDTNRAQDIFSSLTQFIPIQPESFFTQFLSEDLIFNSSSFGDLWENEFITSEQKHSSYLKNCLWSDLKAHREIQEIISNYNVNIQMGNSTSVRYFQLFTNLKNAHYNGNRGVSGIDGSSSTAVGAAHSSSELTVLVTGDLSFIYDQNALWNTDLPANLKIIVINNQGGDIFNIIPGPKTTPFAEKFFNASHDLSLEKIAATFNVNYQCANNEEQLQKTLKHALNTDETEIVEVFTGKCKNDEILNDYFYNIKK